MLSDFYGGFFLDSTGAEDKGLISDASVSLCSSVSNGN